MAHGTLLADGRIDGCGGRRTERRIAGVGGEVVEPQVDVGDERRQVDPGRVRPPARRRRLERAGSGRRSGSGRCPAGLPRTSWTYAAATLMRPCSSARSAVIVGAHPGRFELLVGLEEVAALVGGQPGGDRRRPLGLGERPIGLGPSVASDDDGPLGHVSSVSGRRLGEPGVESVPEPDRRLAALPAQPDLAARPRAPGSRPGRARCRAGSARAHRSGPRRPPSGR